MHHPPPSFARFKRAGLWACLALCAAAASPTVAAPAAADAPPDHALLRRVHESASEMVMTAMNYIGVRYRRGGSSVEAGFDCSGFTRYIFEQTRGLVLPRRADEQASAPGLIAVRRDELQPGDLVFFNTLRRTFSHVGIYIGNNRFIHAPRPGAEVRTEDIGFAYWAKRFTGARRAEVQAEPQPGVPADSAPATPGR